MTHRWVGLINVKIMKHIKKNYDYHGAQANDNAKKCYIA